MAGLRLPIESHVLQAFVSEGVKPLIDTVITFGAGHFYISQSDKGGLVFGGDIDGYNSYAQRGNLPAIEEVMEEAVAMFPSIGRLRVLRHWGGLMDMSMDGSPIIDKTPIDNLYLNCGWCYRRLQGDTRFRLVLRASHRAGRASRGRGGLCGSIVSRPAGSSTRAAPARSRTCIRAIRSMRIPCPHCGERDVGEFAYHGDATKRRPDGASDIEAFFDYVYPRDNPAGPHRELWYHARRLPRLARREPRHAHA